jgi:hypothetical protein
MGSRTIFWYKWTVTRRRYSPPERKRLSLERDTVDRGEYPKAFRRSHPVKQAKAERAMRREVHRRLAAGREDVEAVSRRVVRKWPPARLGELIQQKVARREHLRQEPRRSTEARERRRTQR